MSLRKKEIRNWSLHSLPFINASIMCTLCCRLMMQFLSKINCCFRQPSIFYDCKTISLLKTNVTFPKGRAVFSICQVCRVGRWEQNKKKRKKKAKDPSYFPSSHTREQVRDFPHGHFWASRLRLNVQTCGWATDPCWWGQLPLKWHCKYSTPNTRQRWLCTRSAQASSCLRSLGLCRARQRQSRDCLML